ncbi:MAG: hypothetical protein KTR14_01540, partial [Vampirovibrio sp.]|nr:hypothetical protein [Vampirovibrio sp.]
MSAELQLLRIDNENEIRPVSVSSMDLDQRLESILVSNIRFLDPNLMLVGHQITTLYHGQIDLLAIDSDGKMWVIALKKDRIPRDIISQLLDYGSWIAGLNYSQIKDLYEKYNTDSFEAAFENAFGLTPPETINEAHQLVLVSSTLDPVAERIMGYLTDFGLNINAIQFSYFGDEQREYLSRRWYRDPKALDHADSLANKNTKKEAWNGHDYYVTFDENHQRHWEDAVKYGFISAGGAKRHSNALKQLAAGDR